MTPAIGSYIWLPCEVKPGPFSDERLVKLRSDISEWVGFVDVNSLEDPIEEGQTKVKSLVVDAKNGNISAKLPGAAVAQTLFRTKIRNL